VLVDRWDDIFWFTFSICLLDSLQRELSAEFRSQDQVPEILKSSSGTEPDYIII